MSANTLQHHAVYRGAIVEEHVLQRNRAVELLESRAGVEIVHAADSMPSLFAWLQDNPRSRWPHLLVLELHGGQRSARDIRAVEALRDAGLRVLLLSALGADRAAQRLARSGVDGVVSKRDSEEAFLDAVALVLGGDTVITDHAAAELPDLETTPPLSAQEARVLELYAAGMTIAEVAVAIGVRQDTARKYLSRVKQKYEAVGRPARTKLELAQRAMQDGYAHMEILIADR
ncbi:MAG: LuxR C-terminal-related transcriptional regulator [Actinomycetota bacterium]